MSKKSQGTGDFGATPTPAREPGMLYCIKCGRWTGNWCAATERGRGQCICRPCMETKPLKDYWKG